MAATSMTSSRSNRTRGPGDMRRPDEKMHIDRLEEILAGKCRGRVIHFGGCRTIEMPAARIRKFLRATGAVAIGMLALLASVIWERYREWLTDPYRDIQR